MRIDSIILRELKIPLVAAFETSGWREEEKSCIIVEMKSGSLSGFGECAVSPGPWYGPETTASAWHVMREYFAPASLRKKFAVPEDLVESLSFVRGNNMAKASFDMALHDLAAKQERVSLSRLYGGTKRKIESGVSVGIQDSARKLVDTVTGYLHDGYRRIKIKIKPGKDLEQVSTLREHFPDLLLMADANGAYEPSDAQALFKLDNYGLMMIEQPFGWDDLVEHANLQRALKTPICLDESVSSTNDLKTALALKSLRILNLKPARVGGITVSKTIHEICQEHKIPIWCGGLLETGIGRAHNVAMASLPGFTLPNDISASNRYFKEDIVNPEFRLNPDGTITVPTGKGIGVDIDYGNLSKHTLRAEQFGS
ncbi:o-succinylbenzoate synthase [Candidatus Bathyarchaeota archaeon]|nr:o-succinylbenzoate synthase [Candidatus Bathyarchaeota archaeon]